MRTSRLRLAALAGVAAAVLATAPGRGLDADFDPSAPTLEKQAGLEFTNAFAAYSEGDKSGALALYRSAADKGHIGALWKIGRMYATGDGIEPDPAQAFVAYQQMAQRHGNIPPNDRDAVYVASAFVSLADMLRTGVDGSVEADAAAARNVYFYAASYFGNREAQYALGRMFLAGEGGPESSRQAARWLKLAADKGHIAAEAVLGEMLFDGNGVKRRPTLGLSMLTRARHFARGEEREWIAEMQERAFSAATEEVRRAATEIAAGQIDLGG